jgi:hypothetical protein
MVCFSTELPMAAFPGGDQYKVMILESDPRPGYFAEGGFPEHLKHVHDHHLYVVIKNPVSCMQDKIIRYACRIKKENNLSLHASPGQLTLFNETHPCIRIRTTEVAYLDVFISEFQKIGIDFMHKKHVKPYTSFIQYKKQIDFVKMGEGIYKDANEPNRYFVSIAKDIEFDMFKKMMTDTKNNCDFNLFDAALVYYHENDCTHDMVSLYSEHCDEKRLPEMKEFLDREINKLMDK